MTLLVYSDESLCVEVYREVFHGLEGLADGRYAHAVAEVMNETAQAMERALSLPKDRKV